MTEGKAPVTCACNLFNDRKEMLGRMIYITIKHTLMCNSVQSEGVAVVSHIILVGLSET